MRRPGSGWGFNSIAHRGRIGGGEARYNGTWEGMGWDSAIGVFKMEGLNESYAMLAEERDKSRQDSRCRKEQLKRIVRA